MFWGESSAHPARDEMGWDGMFREWHAVRDAAMRAAGALRVALCGVACCIYPCPVVCVLGKYPVGAAKYLCSTCTHTLMLCCGVAACCTSVCRISFSLCVLCVCCCVAVSRLVACVAWPDTTWVKKCTSTHHGNTHTRSKAWRYPRSCPHSCAWTAQIRVRVMARITASARVRVRVVHV